MQKTQVLDPAKYENMDPFTFWATCCEEWTNVADAAEDVGMRDECVFFTLVALDAAYMLDLLGLRV